MEPPIKPDETDCCNSGCNPCILDSYEEQLKKYKQRLERDQNDLNRFKNCLITTAYSIFSVRNIQRESADALLITFEFKKLLKSNIETDRVMYNPGQYFMLKNGEYQKPYTPVPIHVSNPLQFTVLVKLYESGRMSRYIRKLEIDSKTIWRGPYGDFNLLYDYKHILLIAQGVGIAPLYTIIHNITQNEDCETFLKLFYCCKTYDTIYLRNRLYDLQHHWNFSYDIFLGNSDNSSRKYNETIHEYKLDACKIKEFLSDKTDSIQVLVCGNESFAITFKQIVMNCNIQERNISVF
ncbi:unnamed protein product [Phyllotreta striolata]|uniref:FAD-binding FR-type domain-containing protein n=1 Tax=Phyllotreta striolata TaxID=444603 RepID=A0A9N9TTU7_PHYSR|nr:unnamed protein product [Phyllotreta striolata]